MKELSAGDTRGFSVIEIMMALAIMTMVLIAAGMSTASVQYWRITAAASGDALDRAHVAMETQQISAVQSFYAVASSPPQKMDDAACVHGGLCYFSETMADAYSSCIQAITTRVSWRVGAYPTSTIDLFTTLANPSEVIALGGDCELEKPNDTWAMMQERTHTDLALGTIHDMDVFAGTAYIVDDTSPYFHIVGTDDNCTNCIDTYNAVDVARDFHTGRTYAYVAIATTTRQLGIIDVTNPSHTMMVATRSLSGATGSYPQGWRVHVYGDRLYILTRETAGPEFHIFNIADPTQPIEQGSGINLGRTVMDFSVRDQRVVGTMHRFVFLAAKAGLKELSVLDVTGDTIREIGSVDLPGNSDATSIALSGSHLYLGRDAVTNGPELYVFDVANPILDLSQHIIATAEVGARIMSMRTWGTYLFMGTSKSGSELQVWNIASSSPVRAKNNAVPRLAERGLEIDGMQLYTLLQGSPTSLHTWYAP